MAEADFTQPTLWDTGEPLRRCSRCGACKPLGDFFMRSQAGRRYRDTYCKPCRANYQREYLVSNPDKKMARKAAFRRYMLFKNYGIDEQAYESMLASQGGRCAICGGPPIARWGVLGVDHDHATGKVRGLLCDPCNTLLGLAKDDAAVLDRAAAYLRRHGR